MNLYVFVHCVKLRKIGRKKKWNVTKFKSYNVRQYQVFQDLMFGTPSLLINCVFDLLASFAPPVKKSALLPSSKSRLKKGLY